MFENLSSRERKLTFGVLGLLPASLIFMGIFWFINSYGENNSEAMRLLTDIETEETRMMQGIEANRRRAFYNSVSLPPSINNASNEYQSWLKLLLDEVQMEISSFTPRDLTDIKYKREVIGRRKVFNVQARGDLEQLNTFLSRFYSVELMHRINSLKVIPLTEGVGDKKVRSGALTIIMSIEIVSLVEADNRDEFTNVVRGPSRPADEYAAILRRNIFGPANNPPTLNIRSTSLTTGTDASVSISAEDVDKQDQLKFELIKSSVEGATLTQSTAADRNARFVVPSQEPGSYDFEVKVSDSGFPPKETIEKFSVTFKEKPIPPVVEPEPPKPIFKHATQTRVTGIAKAKDGQWQAWITVRTTNDRYKLKAGETFELDGMTWLVKSVDAEKAIFQAGDKFFVARPNPKERGQLVEIPDPAIDTDA